MSQSVIAELAPHGVLRAGINMSNFLLVTGKTASGDPEGVSPDMARAIADRLGVPVKYVPYPKPGELADAAGGDVWDIGLIGAEPARAEKIAFTAAYVEIEATYLVPAGSPLQAIADVDRPGVRIAVTARSAYDLWLERNIKHAELVRSDSLASATEIFVRDKLDALAGLRPGLLKDIEKLPGARILDGQFSAVQQAVGTARTNAAGAAVPARVRRGGQSVRPGRAADREAQGGRPPLGRAGRLSGPEEPGNARPDLHQAHGFRAARNAAAADAAAADRADGAAGAHRRSDDRRRIGGIRRAVEGDGGEDRRVSGAVGRHAGVQDHLRRRSARRTVRVR